MSNENRNTGHGHVTPRPDGAKARCGGPPMCKECCREQAALAATPQQPAQAPVLSEHLDELISRIKQLSWRAGELWERHQGKGWGDKASDEFDQIRDVKVPEAQAQLRALLSTNPKSEPAAASSAPGENYEDLVNALHRIDTAAVFLPGFEVRHEGGLQAVVQNIVEAIGRCAAVEAPAAAHEPAAVWIERATLQRLATAEKGSAVIASICNDAPRNGDYVPLGMQPAASDRDARDDYAVEINRLRNVIQAACTGGLSYMIERWVVLFPDAPVPTVNVDADQKTWCGYVGGMVGAYLGFDVDDPRNATIASIIERRLWAFPKEAK